MNHNGSVSVGGEGGQETEQEKNLLSEKMLFLKGSDLRGSIESLANSRLPCSPPAHTLNIGEIQY